SDREPAGPGAPRPVRRRDLRSAGPRHGDLQESPARAARRDSRRPPRPRAHRRRLTADGAEPPRGLRRGAPLGGPPPSRGAPRRPDARLSDVVRDRRAPGYPVTVSELVGAVLTRPSIDIDLAATVLGREWGIRGTLHPLPSERDR